MALQDYYNTGDDAFYSFLGGNAWKAQTFTANQTYTIGSLKLKLSRFGTPGNVTVSIRATAGGAPSGADLCVETFDGDTLSALPTYEWKEVTFSSPVELTSGVTYAIVVRVVTSTLYWGRDSTSSTYSGGGFYQSANAGVDWSLWSDTEDAMFETYSAPSYVDGTGEIVGTGGLSATCEVVTIELETGSLSGISALTGTLEEVFYRDGTGTVLAVSSLSGTIFSVFVLGTGSVAGISYLIGELTEPQFFDALINRPPIYDKTKVWDEISRSWISNDGRGGGRFREQLIAIGQQADGNSKIFVSDL